MLETFNSFFCLSRKRAEAIHQLESRFLKGILRSLNWWRSPAITKSCLFHDPQQLVLTTDTSLFGCRVHCQSWVAQGRWSTHKQNLNINWLELRAVSLALHQFQGSVSVSVSTF